MTNIIEWIKLKRDQRRERLLRKWMQTGYFKSISMGDRLEFEYISLVPKDEQWHHLAMTVETYVKKDKSYTEGTTYIDGVKLVGHTIGEKE